ncbi:MAG: hypothetical protein HY961_21695 [Ignavibacteriae bacterium]|nr:hypothetical protein [Ignavibacteriota bacterium]
MNYPLRPIDTSPEVEKLQIEIIRKMSEQERQMRAAELIRSCRQLQEQGVRHRHPDYTDEEVRIAAIRMRIGEDFFRKAYPEFMNLLP